MRRDARVDANHLEICRALEKCGCSVLSIASIGRGAPDIAIGLLGNTYLAEIKNGKKGKINDRQKEFHENWKAPILVFRSKDEAIVWASIEGGTF